MAAETDVQFFSHLNSGCPQLTNDWGCMINLLDACLVNGVSLPTVSSVSVATGGNITVNFAAAHSVLLFQCVTLAGFSPDALNGKYRVVGVPNTTQLTLSSDLSAQSATTMGTAKISPLGYQIVYSANTKRVYRALNPTANHPYIRVDESLSSADGSTGIYPSNYAKSAMVGLLANMDSIDDYENNDVLQLPFDASNPSKNWQISGQNTNCIRGWSKWYWASQSNLGALETGNIIDGGRGFTLCGDRDAFYLDVGQDTSSPQGKKIYGCGLYNPSTGASLQKNWFLMTTYNRNIAASGNVSYLSTAFFSLMSGLDVAKFSVPRNSIINEMVYANPILPNYQSGLSGIFNATNVAALEIPFYDDQSYLRGSLKHVCYCGNNMTAYQQTTPILADNSMYIFDSANASGANSSGYVGGVLFYVGELQ